jgi:excisionase family DNA binding protein
MERLTVTVTEAAEILGVSRTSAYELVRAGALPSVRLGRRIVIRRTTLEELVGSALPDLPSLNGVLRKPASEARPATQEGSPSPCSRARRG